MDEDDSTDNTESDHLPDIQFGGEGDVYINDCNFGDQDMGLEDEVDTIILDSQMDGSLEAGGNSAYIKGLEFSGTGDSAALELSDTQASIFDLRVNPGYRYGLTARDSLFTIDDSEIRGDKNDLRFCSGVVADLYNVEAEDILDRARGAQRPIQEGIIEETISTTDKQLRAEEIARQIGKIMFLIGLYFTTNDVYNAIN